MSKVTLNNLKQWVFLFIKSSKEASRSNIDVQNQTERTEKNQCMFFVSKHFNQKGWK